MRILHILDHSLPLQDGYVYRTMGILREQRALGWETIQLTTPKHLTASSSSELIDGWEFHRTPALRDFLSKFPLANHLSVIRETMHTINALIEKGKPDIIHVHSPVLNVMSALPAARKCNIPLVYEVRAFWEDAAVEHGTTAAGRLRYKAIRYLETKAFTRVQEITTISEGLRREILERGVPPEKITLVPNAVDTEAFSPVRKPDPEIAQRLGILGHIVLGYVGSFLAYEGLDLLLRAIPGVLASRPAIKVVFVGSGPEENRLRELARSLRIASKIEFVGLVPHEQIHKYYELIDVLVYPRLSSRLTELVTPLKPLEAMAQERVVLASDVGGHRELIEDGQTGYLFKADDGVDLTRRILEILGSQADWIRVRASAKRFVERERTWRIVVAKYRDVYARALGCSVRP